MLNQLNTTTKRELEERFTTLSNKVNNYSATEQKVGKYGDDDLYQITIDCGLLWASMNKAITTEIVIDKIISIEGVALSNSEILPLPYNGRQVNDGGISLYITKGSDNKATINLTTFSDRTSYHGYVTIQYTKPTQP